MEIELRELPEFDPGDSLYIQYMQRLVETQEELNDESSNIIIYE